jgi:hypothetical protein
VAQHERFQHLLQRVGARQEFEHGALVGQLLFRAVLLGDIQRQAQVAFDQFVLSAQRSP